MWALTNWSFKINSLHTGSMTVESTGNHIFNQSNECHRTLHSQMSPAEFPLCLMNKQRKDGECQRSTRELALVETEWDLKTDALLIYSTTLQTTPETVSSVCVLVLYRQRLPALCKSTEVLCLVMYVSGPAAASFTKEINVTWDMFIGVK